MPHPCNLTYEEAQFEPNELITAQLEALTQALNLNKHIAKQFKYLGHAMPDKPSTPGGESSHSSLLCCSPHQRGPDSIRFRPRGLPAIAADSVLLEPFLSKGNNGDDNLKRSNISAASTKSRKDSLFPKVDDIKECVTECLALRNVDVEDLYSPQGCYQAIARSDYFKYFGLFVVVLNTLWLGIETDLNKGNLLCDAPVVFQIIDNFFCCFFCAEIWIRFRSFTKKKDALTDNWFVFDLALACLMAWETWIEVLGHIMFGFVSDSKSSDSTRSFACFRMFRLLRLLRVFRAARLIRNVPELLILVRGIMLGFRSMVAVLGLSCLVIYIFAIIFTELLAGKSVAQGDFDSVLQSMNFLLRTFLCGPDADFMIMLLHAHWSYYVLFICFVLITVLTILNMLIGILCDIVTRVSQESQEEAFEREVEYQVNRLAELLDQDGSGTISIDEFETIIRDPDLASGFYDIGVDIIGLADFARFIFESCEEITYTEFAQLVSEFRGTKSATVKDLMALRRYLSMELMCLEARFFERHLTPDSNGSVHVV